MSKPLPPPLPAGRKVRIISQPQVLLILILSFVTLLVIVRLTGLACPYTMPTSGMDPTISAGDHFLVEGFSYLFRKPKRGDIAAFKTDRIPEIPANMANQVYLKRIVGEPGDKLQIMDENLYVNGTNAHLQNEAGPIRYVFLEQTKYLRSSNETFTVPEESYFVIGDNAGNSFDSRSWGVVPAKSIKGRACFRYISTNTVGRIK